ncbi:MAG: 1-deoxy-D-xylulose-5-phosphate reductoisomerase [bacterium]|nr:MAG: 1-deoxy-D-xylulose-5-phosphate reductoisomerase [bacterium]
MKRIVILGSTGSIGTNTLDIIAKFPDTFRAVGLTAGTNVEKLEEQIRTFSPAAVAMADDAAAERLRARCKGLKTTILSGADGLRQVATMPEADLVISAIVGGAGLVPTLAAIKAGKFIALANKEPMTPGRGHPAADPDRIRRPALEHDEGAAAARHGRAGPQAPELEDGRQDHD